MKKVQEMNPDAKSSADSHDLPNPTAERMNKNTAWVDELRERRNQDNFIYTLDTFILKKDIIPIFYEENIMGLRMREMICLFYDLNDFTYKILMYTPTSKYTQNTTLNLLKKYTYTINKGTDFKELSVSLPNLSDFMRQHLFLFDLLFNSKKYIKETIQLLYKHFNKNKNNKIATMNNFSVNIAESNISTNLFPRRDIYGKYKTITAQVLLYKDYGIISFGNINFVYTANYIIKQKSIVNRIKKFISRSKQQIVSLIPNKNRYSI